MERRSFRHFLIFAILLLLTLSAHAAFIETGVFYFTDSLAVSGATTSNTYTFYDGAIGFDIQKKKKLQVGWSYAVFSVASSSSGTTSAYSSTQMGPKFNWYLDKDRNWVLSLAYHLITTASYTATGSTTAVWKGTAIMGSFGYVFRPSEDFGWGLKIGYNSASYTEQLINDSTYSKITNSRVHIYPQIYMAYDF